MIKLELGGKLDSMVTQRSLESKSSTELIAAEEESTTLRSLLVRLFVEQSRNQDKEHGYKSAAELKETSSRSLVLQDNIFISVVSEYGDSVEEESQKEEQFTLDQRLLNSTEREPR